MTAPAEEWRPISGFEGIYEVSSRGRVRSLLRVLPDGRTRQGKILRASRKSDTGRLRVSLARDGKIVSANVHRLVAVAFLGEPPDGKGLVLHSDGDHLNNHVENLRWGTYSDNTQDAIAHGTHRNQYTTASEVLALRRDIDRLIIHVARIENRLDFDRAARAYFDAHPEPKPWHDAKEGEVWELTFGKAGSHAWFVNGAYFQSTKTLTNIFKTDPDITAARRIWPKENDASST